MPNAPAATELPGGAQRDRLLGRFAELRSGRERPGRYWRIDLDAIGYDAGRAAPYAAPTIEPAEMKTGFALDLRTAAERHPELFARAARRALDPENAKFAALAAALCNTGAFVYVPADTALDEPVSVTYAAGEGGLFPYTLVYAERGAQCTIVERIEGAGASFVCGISEIVTEANANVTYAVDQQLPADATLLFTRAARPGRDAKASFCVAHLGAGLCADSIAVSVRHPGIDVQIDALFFPTGAQHVDLVTTVSHEAGESRSRTAVKSAAAGAGQARYLGNIAIAPHAQATESALRDDALLLSKHAHIDSVPALEIAANDVKAYHGATVGALDEEQIFYMTSRGLERSAAEKMIALGFFEPVIERFPGNALRERLRAQLEAKAGS